MKIKELYDFLKKTTEAASKINEVKQTRNRKSGEPIISFFDALNVHLNLTAKILAHANKIAQTKIIKEENTSLLANMSRFFD